MMEMTAISTNKTNTNKETFRVKKSTKKRK